MRHLLLILSLLFTAACAQVDADRTYEPVEEGYMTEDQPPVERSYSIDDAVVGSPPPAAYADEYSADEARMRELYPEDFAEMEADLCAQGELEFCPSPVAEAFILPSFDNIADQLIATKFGYFVPDTVNIDEVGEVRMVINPESDEAEITASLGGEVTHVSTIAVSKIVEARLTSSDFDVTAVTPTRQAVDATTDTVWLWEIAPREPGSDKSVKITVNAIITIGQDRAERALEVYEKKVRVDITSQQWISKWIADHWQWGIGTLILPLGLWLWRRRQQRDAQDNDRSSLPTSQDD